VLFKKWVDQGISVNHYYNPNLYEGNKVPAKVVNDMIDFYKYGGKQLYYANTLDTIEARYQKKKMKQDVDQVDLYIIIKVKKKDKELLN
jgi:hypothetical protein